MHIDPCEFLERTNIGDIIIEMMNLSLSDRKERGIVVYENNNGIFMTEIQKGDTHSIKLEYPENQDVFSNTEILGLIHTHPNEAYDSLFSLTDIKTLIESDFHFSASIFDEDKQGDILVDIFTDRGLGSIRELNTSISNTNNELDYIKQANDFLLECTLNMGRSVQ